jgi:hypothetical protein
MGYAEQHEQPALNLADHDPVNDDASVGNTLNDGTHEVRLDAPQRLRQATLCPTQAAERPMPSDYTPYQQKIIRRYYHNQDAIQRQRLAELVTELYLSEGKKREKAWQSAAAAMQKLGVPQSRIDYLVRKGDPALVAEVVKELEGNK